MDAISDSSVRSKEDLAGVFEFDGETAHFYLYSTRAGEARKVLGAIHVLTGEPDFSVSDISIRWSSDEEKVGLFIRHTLWALFDCIGQTKHGGDYRVEAEPKLPEGSGAGF